MFGGVRKRLCCSAGSHPWDRRVDKLKGRFSHGLRMLGMLLVGHALGDLANPEFLAMLYYKQGAVCAGTLYTPTVLLTAATCFTKDRRDYSVLTSATLVAAANCSYAKNRLYGEEGVLARRIKLKKVVKHPDFDDYGTSAFNIAIASLAHYPHTYPRDWRLVDLDEFRISSLVLKDLVLVGWANSWDVRFGAYGLPPTTVALDLASQACSHPKPRFPDAEFCPFPAATHPTMCDYYFGSPLVLTTTLPVTVVGFKSWSGFCTPPLRSQAFVRSSAIFDWAESFVASLSPRPTLPSPRIWSRDPL